MGARRGGRRRRGLVVGLGLFVLVAAIGALAALRLRSAAGELRAADRLVDEVSLALEDGRLADARSALTTAQGHLRSAADSLHGNPELDVVGIVPFLGDDLAQLRESLSIASKLVVGGSRILTAAEPLEGADGRLEVSLTEGAMPVDAVAEVAREASALATALPTPSHARRRTGLFGPVAELRDEVADAAEHRREQLSGLAAGLELVADMAGANGERRYLLAIANTAEMRGSGGMILSYGSLVGSGGRFVVGDVERIDGLYLDQPVAPVLGGAPDDYLARWDGFEPLRLWRNANLAADFPIVAPVMEAMYAAATGEVPAGVIQIDPHGLAAILEGVGPVEVEGIGSVAASDVVDLVLRDAYQRHPDTDDRADLLGDVAQAAFDALVEGRYSSLRPLADAVMRAVDGRHILVHSLSSHAQERIRAFGADGALPPTDGVDAVHLTVQNVSANKLDYYLDTALALTGSRPPGELGRLQATVTIANTAPAGVSSPPVVFGPFNSDQQVGLYRGAVSLYLPVGTSLAGARGEALAAPPVVQHEGGRPVVAFHVDVPAGQARTVVLDLDLAPRPRGSYSLVAVPSPRVRPTALAVEIDPGEGQPPLGGTVALDRTWRFTAGAAPERVAPASVQPRAG